MSDLDALIEHVSCGSLDESGECYKCEEIRNILKDLQSGHKTEIQTTVEALKARVVQLENRQLASRGPIKRVSSQNLRIKALEDLVQKQAQALREYIPNWGNISDGEVLAQDLLKTMEDFAI